MYCPNCATPAINHQKFCRQCGQDLNMVAQVLKGQSVIEAWNRPTGLWGLILCITGTTVGAVLKILNKEGIHLGGALGPYLLALAVVMAISGMGLLAYAFLPAMRTQHLSQTPMPTGKPANTQPDLLAEPPATITESTTELFEEETRLAAPVATPHNH
jgi:hypothetical protein